MRHTRMRQIAKANKDPMWMWKEQVGTDTIELMTRVYKLGLKPKLDNTFKWYREHDYGENYIEFGDCCLKVKLRYSK